MDAIDTMLKAADALNSTRRNLMGLAELCMAMDTMTGEDIWGALYNFAVCCAEQTQERDDDLIRLIAKEQEPKSEQIQPVFGLSVDL